MVSLDDLGTLHFDASVSNISLADINSSDAYTRTNASSGYDRVNPFQVANGNAPAPSAGNVTLSDYESYNQSALNQGSNLQATSRTYNALNVSISFSWTLPSGYVNATSAVRQRAFYQTCIEPPNTDCESSDPFSGATEVDMTDGISDTITGLSYDTYYLIGMQAEWDGDGDGTYEFPILNGTYYYTIDATPTLGTENNAGDGIYVWTGTTTTTTTTSTCFCIGDPCPSFTPQGVCSAACLNAGSGCACGGCFG